MTIPVSYYGLHSFEGIQYLHQGRNNAGNFIGLAKPSPFEVEIKKKRACPHLINKAAPVPDPVQWSEFLRIFHDPLVQMMLPTPRDRMDRIPYLNDPNNQLAMPLVILSRLSSPIYQVVHPIRKMTKGQLIDELSLTNVCPLVLTGVQTEDNAYMMELAQEARLLPRRLVFTGAAEVVVRDPLQRIQTTLWDVDELRLAGLPMENLGALLLRRYARGEVLDSELRKGA